MNDSQNDFSAFEIPSEYDQNLNESRVSSGRQHFDLVARQKFLEEQDVSLSADQSVVSGVEADDESNQSRIIHSRGMDKMRKSIIQQNSERYLAKKSQGGGSRLAQSKKETQ